MKVGCCGLGIVGMVFKAISRVFELLVAMIVYLGLYWPIFYLVVIFGLWLWGDMTFEPSVDLALFYVGLVVSLLCSLVVTLRHLIFEPFGRFLDKRQEKKEMMIAKAKERSRERRDREREKSRNRNDDRYEGRRNVPAPPPRDRMYDNYSYRAHSEMRGERPLVYRSRQDRSLIIYEYRDRFEVYRDSARGLVHLDTKWK